MAALAADKDAMRRAAFARRKAVHVPGRAAAGALSEVLAGHRGVPVSGYAQMRTEIDPAPALEEASAWGPVGLPVIEGAGRPLRFRLWTPGCAMADGPFGAQVPAAGDWMVPQIVIVPLLAFDRTGARLGYGGGFYDRTLEELRARGPVLAVGFAYAAQEVEAVPVEATDQRLDLVVTERGVLELAG